MTMIRLRIALFPVLLAVSLLAVPLPIDLRGVPDPMFLYAFLAAMSVRMAAVVPVFWWCGLMADVFAGPRLGAQTLLYSLTGVLVAGLRFRFRDDHTLTRILACSLLMLLVAVFRPVVETGRWSGLSEEYLASHLQGAGLTVLAFAPLEWLFRKLFGYDDTEDE